MRKRGVQRKDKPTQRTDLYRRQARSPSAGSGSRKTQESATASRFKHNGKRKNILIARRQTSIS